MIVDNLEFQVVRQGDGASLSVTDLSNKHTARLGVNKRGKFYVISSTFPPQSKRYFEMLYIAEVNKERLWAN